MVNLFNVSGKEVSLLQLGDEFAYRCKAQERALNQTLRTCQELYNAALQERRDAYKLAGISITYQDQQNQLPEIKQCRPNLKEVHSLVLQNVLRRLDRAMQAFFRR